MNKQMDYTLILTAWNEPVTVAETLRAVLDPKRGNLLDNLEILLVCPDVATAQAAKKVIDSFSFAHYRHLTDPKKGKPHALNMAFQNARGAILICTDGDVLIGDNALPKLVSHFDQPEIGGVCGRPRSADNKDTLFGYIGNLLADGAHDKRSKVAAKGKSYYMSGYLFAMRNVRLTIPEDSLADDAVISLMVLDKGLSIAYEPEATVFVKYPKNLSDWIRQKKRSVGGYSGIAEHKTSVTIEKRSIFEEAKYALFPLRYARTAKQLLFSIALYPLRLWLWIVVFWSRKVVRTSFDRTWERVESTK